MMWLRSMLLLVILSFSDEGRGETCQGAIQYDRCSSNIGCGCLPLLNSENGSICGFFYLKCSELVACAHNNRICYQPGHVCVKHPRCQNAPLCYPLDMAHPLVCPPVSPVTTTPTAIVPDDGICANATWNPNGVTVAGGNGEGSGLNQLRYPWGFFVDHDAAIYVADTWNFRVVKWAPGALSGRVMAGGNGQGNEANQLKYVTKIDVAKNGTIFLCDRDNKRVQRWFKDDNHGQTIIENISCWGLAIDNKETLYISNLEKHCVTKWPGDEIVAGGNGQGHGLNQLSEPADVFIDHDQSIFVADYENDRVMKWAVNAKEGIVVAGGNGQGDAANQLDGPRSIVVDHMGTIYVADSLNHRIMRWFKGSKSGSVIIGGRGIGGGIDQLDYPEDVAFDPQGNLYVDDLNNNRVQMFSIDKSACVKVSN